MVSVVIDDKLIEQTEQKLFDLFDKEVYPLYSILDDKIDNLIRSLQKEDILSRLEETHNKLLKDKQNIYLGLSEAAKESLGDFRGSYSRLIEFPDTETAGDAPEEVTKEYLCGYRGGIRRSLKALRKEVPEKELKKIVDLEKKILAFEYMAEFVKSIEIENKRLSLVNHSQMRLHRPLYMETSKATLEAYFNEKEELAKLKSAGTLSNEDIDEIYGEAELDLEKSKYKYKCNFSDDSFDRAKRIMKQIRLNDPTLDVLKNNCDTLAQLSFFKYNLLLSYWDFVQKEFGMLGRLDDIAPGKYDPILGKANHGEFNSVLERISNSYKPIQEELKLYKEVLALHA